jgi:glycosyltransferase involved in cell wall biosynthesis
VSQDSALPRISVVVPTLNEAGYIGECLDSVLASLAPVGGEVLVVDGGSTDGTRGLVTRYAGRRPEVRLVENPARVTPWAFNLGIRDARHPLIAIISAHSRVAPDFFTAARSRLATGEADIVGGPVGTEPGRPGLMGWLLAQVVSHPFGVGNSRFRVSVEAAYVDAVPFALFRREVFDRIGLFDTALVRNQDTEFFGRVARAGLRVFLDPAVRSVYRARGTLAGLLRQGFRNAYWNVRVWRQNPAAFQWRHAIPGLFTLSLLAGAGLAPWLLPVRWLLLGEVGIYAIAAAAASAHIALRTGRGAALLLPPLFFVYHFCYGAGSLAGLRWLGSIGEPGEAGRAGAP